MYNEEVRQVFQSIKTLARCGGPPYPHLPGLRRADQEFKGTWEGFFFFLSGGGDILGQVSKVLSEEWRLSRDQKGERGGKAATVRVSLRCQQV